MNGRGRAIILGLLAAVGVGIVALAGTTVPKDAFAGAIGAAKRYQVTQITGKDVVLERQGQVLQSNSAAGRRVAIQDLDVARHYKLIGLDRHYKIVELGKRILWNEFIDPS